VARDLSDVASFLDALLETGRFYDAAPISQQRRDDGTYNAVVEASYLSSAGELAPAPAPEAPQSDPPPAPGTPR
jgi:hypothetical protein